jgi:protein tyrosine phosphatase
LSNKRFERVRCHKYWPKLDETRRYGGLSVKLVKTATLPGIQLRKLLLTDRSGKESLCNMVQMTEWPDFGVPNSSEHVRNVLDILDHYLAAGGGPPVVHCSAGVGRTGSFIAIHASLCQV